MDEILNTEVYDLSLRTSLEKAEFKENLNIGSLILPSIKKIPFECFCGCANITNIEMPEGIRNLGASSFMGCTSLTGVNVPTTTINIQTNAFKNCSALSSVNFSGTGISTIGKSSFAHSAIINLIIPDGVETIDEYAFSGIEALISLSLPASIKYINKGAFKNCENLSNVVLRGELAEDAVLDKRAFIGCDNMDGIHTDSKIIVVPTY